jgi:hypothetical protein
MALFVTAVLLAVMVGLNMATDTPVPGMVVVVGTAIWAAADSSALELHKYEGGTSGPFVVFLAVLLVWVILFPVYLVLRSRQSAGELKPKKEYQAEFEARAARDTGFAKLPRSRQVE